MKHAFVPKHIHFAYEMKCSEEPRLHDNLILCLGRGPFFLLMFLSAVSRLSETSCNSDHSWSGHPGKPWETTIKLLGVKLDNTHKKDKKSYFGFKVSANGSQTIFFSLFVQTAFVCF